MWLFYKLIFFYLNKRIDNKANNDLIITFPNKKKLILGKNKNCLEISINSNTFLVKLLFFGLPYLGYGYSKGYWHTKNLNALLEYGEKNKELFKSLSLFNFFSLLYTCTKNLISTNTITKSKKQIGFHYDLGNTFYKLWLDKSMTYSSGIFNNSNNLEEAQYNKYQSLIKSTNINKKTNILEIGCGWGGFLKYVNSNIKSSITGITISKKQYGYIKKENISKVEYKDYRNVSKKYDRIISIEMFEAVGKKNWNIFFKSLNNLITANGKIGLQIITISEMDYKYYMHRQDFIQKYIFPGGMLPTKKALKDLALKNNLIFSESKSFGNDYAKTLSIWKSNFFKNWLKIEKLGFDNNFKRLWEYYLSYCEIGFKTGALDVSQFLLEKKNKHD